MARIRNLKPAFFKDEDLAELPPLTRILFAGLWTLADKAGNLEDRPRFIKIEVLPYDACAIVEMLDALAAGGFVVRYKVAGRAYLHIPMFTKHQRVCGSEAAAPTSIPPPNLAEQRKHGRLKADADRKRRGSTKEAPRKHIGSTPDDVGSTQDPGVLSTEYGVRSTDDRRAAPRLVSSSSTDPEASQSQALVDLWNRIRGDDLVFRDLPFPERRRLRDAVHAQALDWWERVFARIAASDYLAGRGGLPAVKLRKALELGDRIAAGQYDTHTPPARVAGLAGGGVVPHERRTVTVLDPDVNGAPYRFACAHTPTCASWPQCRAALKADEARTA